MHAFFYWTAAFTVLQVGLGDMYPRLMFNERCYPYLGCNLGPAGYDGLMHLISGVCVVFGLWWAHERGWLREPSARAVLLWSVSIALAWELFEWGVDGVHALVRGSPVPIESILQPGGADLWGDIALALLGTAAAYLWIKRKKAAATAAA